MSAERLELLGLPIDVVTEDDVLNFVRKHVENREPAQIVTVNPEFVVRSRNDPDFAAVLHKSDLATADGVGVVWALRRLGARGVERVGGADLIWSICRQAASDGSRVFLLGGEEGVAEGAANRLRASFPQLQIAGTYAGSPDPADESKIIGLVRDSRADILFVAFGAPAQDVWIAKNIASLRICIAIGVGGGFDYLAGVTQRAPRWMQKRGLEWLWRLSRQPWRWRRMLALPRFVWWVLRSSRTRYSDSADARPE